MSGRKEVEVRIGSDHVSVRDGGLVYTAAILNPSPPEQGEPIILDRLIHRPEFKAKVWVFSGCYVTELWPATGGEA